MSQPLGKAPAPDTVPSEVVTALVELDADAVVAAVSRAQAGGATLSAVVGDLLIPAHEEVRRRQRRGELDSAKSLAATALLRRVLVRVAVTGGPRPAPDSPRPLLVVTAPSGMGELFGAEAVAEVLASAGWPVDVVAGLVTPEELARHLDSRRVLAALVVCSDPSTLPEAARDLDAAHHAGVPAVAVGPAYGADDVRALRLGADAWAGTLDGLVATLDGWVAASPDVRQPSGLPGPYLQFDAARERMVEAAVEAGGALVSEPSAASPGELSAGWVRTTAEGVVDHLAAAVLVDDNRVLLDHLSARLADCRRRGILEINLVGLVDAIAGALPDEPARAGELVAESRDHLRRAVVRPVRQLRAVGSPAAGAAAPPTPTVGQAFADLLLLAAMACQAPVALLSVRQPDGSWSTLGHGVEGREGLNDRLLFDTIAAEPEPLEVANLATRLPRSPLVGPPHSLRWAYGLALRVGSEAPLGVVVVLDRCLRQLTKREQRALQAVSRQLTAHLIQVRRTSGSRWAPAPRQAAAPPAPPPDQPPAPQGGAAYPPSPPARPPSLVPEPQQLLRSHEVAVLFDVTERTVINWAAAGKLPSLRTVGGHLRFRSEDVLALLSGRSPGPDQDPNQAS